MRALPGIPARYDDPATTRDGGFCTQKIAVGLWRTKSLRQVAETAPYFRDGQYRTLDDVIRFTIAAAILMVPIWAARKKSSRCIFQGEEMGQLREFLKTLTGDPVPAKYLKDLHNP